MRDDLLRFLAASPPSDAAEPELRGELLHQLQRVQQLQQELAVSQQSSAEVVKSYRDEASALRAKIERLEDELRSQPEARKLGSFVAVQAVYGTINVILGSGDSAQLDPTQAIVLMDKLAKAVEACGKIAPRFTVQDRPAFDPLPPQKKKRERKQREPVQTDLEQAAKAAAESEAAS